MGREIVYCQGCGARLTEQDFDKGRAHSIGHHNFCTQCKPLPRPGSSARTALARKGSGSRQPVATPRTPSRAVPVPDPKPGLPMPAILGAAAALALVAVLVVVFASRKPAPPPPAPPVPVKIDRAEQALADLERFLETKPHPEAVLARVDAARPVVGSGPHAARLKAIEAAARADLERLRPSPVDRLTPFLGEIRKLIEKDGSLARKNDVLSMLDSAARIAGDRLPEVEKLRAEYQERLKRAEAPRDILLPASAARVGGTARVGPLEGTPALTGINSLQCTAEWSADIPRAGLWSVAADQSNGGNEGDYKIVCGPEELRARSKGTGGWDRFVSRDLGRIRLPAGQVTIRLVPTSLRGGLMNLKSLKLSWAGD